MVISFWGLMKYLEWRQKENCLENVFTKFERSLCQIRLDIMLHQNNDETKTFVPVASPQKLQVLAWGLGDDTRIENTTTCSNKTRNYSTENKINYLPSNQLKDTNNILLIDTDWKEGDSKSTSDASGHKNRRKYLKYIVWYTTLENNRYNSKLVSVKFSVNHLKIEELFTYLTRSDLSISIDNLYAT